MAQSNSTVSLTLKIAGNAGAELKKISEQQITATAKVNAQWTKVTESQHRFVRTAKAGTQATVNTAKASGDLLKTNKRLESSLQKQLSQSKTQTQQFRQQKQAVQSVEGLVRKVEKSSKQTSLHSATTAGTWKEAAKSLVAMYGTMQAINALKSTVTTNMDFDSNALELKQTSGMTQAEIDRIKILSIEKSKDVLQTPQDVFSAAMAFGRAGDSPKNIEANMLEAARTATVFRATPEQVANMDFDIRDKMKIDNSRMPAMHNMLYYHANAGRFEGGSMATYAPEMYAALNNVGITGEQGVNFSGALAQVLIKKKAANQPASVKDMMEQGLNDVFQKGVMDGLKKAGVNVEKYAPEGKFYGEDGTAGLFALAEEMKRKGLDNVPALNKAGLGSKDGKTFWLSLMQSVTDIQGQMSQAESSAGQGVAQTHLQEMKHDNYGKLKLAQITNEQLKLSGAGQTTTDVAGNALQFYSENPTTAIALGAGAGLYGYKTYNTVRTNGVSSSSKVLGRAGSVATAAVGGYRAYDAYKNTNLTQQQKNTEYTKAGTSTAGALAGGWAGAKAGALAGGAIGSVVPVVGTAAGALVGGLVGGAAGGFGGWWLGEKSGEAITGSIDASSENQISALQEQNELINSGNQEIIGRLDKLIAATNNVANKTQQPILINGNSLYDAVNKKTETEGNRTSAPLIFK